MNDGAGVCEHGDHEAPALSRFCSEACERCEHESTNDETGCDNICGRGEDEADARLREEHARFKRALTTIRDSKQTANGARLLATHALQDGHTVASPSGSQADK